MTLELLGPPQELLSTLALPGTVGPMASLAAGALRHGPLVILLILQFYSAGAEPTTESEEPCSKALGFNETSGVKDRSSQDLAFCDEHHKRTCCERNHTVQVRNSFAAFSHERSGRCAQLGRLAFCSRCDGDVGTGTKADDSAVLLCPSFCKRWFQSCVDDFFAPGTSGAGSVAPCMPNSLICSPLSEITEDANAFCTGVGSFQVADAEDGEVPCYDGVPAAKTRGKGPRAPWSRPKPKERTYWRRIQDAWYRSGVPYFLQDNAPGFVIAFVVALVTWNLILGRD